MPSESSSKGRFKPVFDYVREVVDERKLPTAVAAVGSKDGPIGVKAYGTWPDGRRVAVDDIYFLFSASKPFTALAVAQLWERGRLHLNEPVVKYIPEFGRNGKEAVTIWHLLTHTSGLEQKVFERILVEKPAPEIDILEEMNNARLEIPCGTKKTYNYLLAFSVLGEIIKRVTGKPHDEYMRENIFAPLGMKDTFFYHEGMDEGRMIPTVNPFDVNVESLAKGRYPAGSLFSTAADLLALGRTLLAGGARDGFTLLSPLTLRNMTTPHTVGLQPYDKADFNGVETGLGWLLPTGSRSLIYRDVYGHHGAGNSMFWIYPSDGLVFVFLSNYAAPAADGMQWDCILNVFSTCIGVLH